VGVDQTNKQTVRGVLTDNVDYLLQDQAELDDQRLRVIDDRTLKSIVSTNDSEQVVKQPLLVRSLNSIYTNSTRIPQKTVISGSVRYEFQTSSSFESSFEFLLGELFVTKFTG